MPVPVTNETLVHQGQPRRYLLARPEAPATGIVLSMHGSTSTPEDQLRLSAMVRLAEEHGAAVAFPEGRLPGRRGFRWDLEGDAEFLAALATELVTLYPDAPRRVCASGMSGGARMACALGAARPDLVAAVGAVAGLRSFPRAPGSRPVPVLAFHGLADRINPYAGHSRAEWTASVPEAAAAWALANGLAGGPVTDTLSRAVSRSRWGDAGAPDEVVLYTVARAGHTWPGSRPNGLIRLFLGRTSRELDATGDIWTFFQSHLGDP
jgi:polyhydroxybutyrate depolymerase